MKNQNFNIVTAYTFKAEKLNPFQTGSLCYALDSNVGSLKLIDLFTGDIEMPYCYLLFDADKGVMTGLKLRFCSKPNDNGLAEKCCDLSFDIENNDWISYTSDFGLLLKVTPENVDLCVTDCQNSDVLEDENLFNTKLSEIKMLLQSFKTPRQLPISKCLNMLSGNKEMQKIVEKKSDATIISQIIDLVVNDYDNPLKH